MKILKLLNKTYPKVPIPLNYKNTFTLLISVLLSAQCTDVNVNNVTKDIAGKAATSGANPLMFMSALSGLLEQNQPQPMQVMPMQQAVRGNPVQVADLSRFYGGIL